MYDTNNVFAKILRDEIPSKRVFENEYAIAFQNIDPRAKTHVLVIPRGEYTDVYDFANRADINTQAGFWRAVAETADVLGIAGNFRIVANTGAGAGQSVFHFHVHLMSDARFKTDF
jgi:diadenosine tetraphosphate (Ap4A) HIT family hydrolase